MDLNAHSLRFRLRPEFACASSRHSEKRNSLARGSLFGLVTALAVVWHSGAQEGDRKPVDFARDILPILSDKCFVCHGPDGEAKEILRLDSFQAATRDLDGHRAIDPSALSKSELITRIFSNTDPMPPKDAEKSLTEGERELLKRWVLAGGQYAVHWAFVPPRKELPKQNSASRDIHVIDRFVEARLRERGIDFAAAAEPETIARRVSLVLTGLPPTPEQLSEFLSDPGPVAYQKLVDDLLASQHFGEHQARYWLDAVRYGDTHGLHLDNRRGIYPYRDWVVWALNRNLPLDQFITWQLAGDLLTNSNLEQRVATGFVRMNPTTSEGGAIPEEFQAKNNFDRVETLGTVFLGMSLTCARCHSHKYDPVPQTEYYRLMAFFNSTAEKSMDGNKYEYGPVVRAPANVAAWKSWRMLESRKKQVLQAAGQIIRNKENTSLTNEWKESGSSRRLDMVADPKGMFVGTSIHEQAIELKRGQKLAEKIFTTTLVAEELSAPRTTRVLSRGEYSDPIGEPLKPGIITVMSTFPEQAPRNRLGLARWLTSRDHPLVARVLVNRIWQRTFGEALVRTPEDFGLQGEHPTDPRLLDFLAVELHECGWNLKRMLRLMVTSRTFLQRSAWRDGIDDPENRLLARGPSHRLDAEVIRDIALWASDLLDTQMGGEGVKPYQPGGLWSALMHPGSNTKKYVKDEGTKLYRRSLYVYWKRTSPHPMMTLFDAPSRESSCVRRSRTNTSLQSLGLLNETQRIEMARVLARRLLREQAKDGDRLNLLFKLLACRNPSSRERTVCMKLLSTMRARFTSAKPDAIALLSIGDAPRDQNVDSVELAAWSQVTSTVLASDISIMLY